MNQVNPVFAIQCKPATEKSEQWNQTTALIKAEPNLNVTNT